MFCSGLSQEQAMRQKLLYYSGKVSSPGILCSCYLCCICISAAKDSGGPPAGPPAGPLADTHRLQMSKKQRFNIQRTARLRAAPSSSLFFRARRKKVVKKVTMFYQRASPSSARSSPKTLKTIFRGCFWFFGGVTGYTRRVRNILYTILLKSAARSGTCFDTDGTCFKGSIKNRH